MNIMQAKQYVSDTVQAYLAQDDDGVRLISPRLQRPLFLVGPPGIGKTAIVSQVAAELGIGLVSYSMTHHTRQSALGLPVIIQCEYKQATYKASEYTMSEIIASIYRYMQKTGVEQGILFLDEINCVSETLYPSMLQFLQFKTFGNHAVPDGWVIMCAGNPTEYNRSVHEFDVVTLDRLRKIEIEPDVDAWKAYAAAAGVHPAVTTFLETEREYFYRIESTPGGKSFVTARGWEDLARMITACEWLNLPVEQDLVEQFLQNRQIAERFSLYYVLFCKYRSDYQIPAILAGEASEDLVRRGRDAHVDERLALVGLLVDALVPPAIDVQVDEAVLLQVRDVLRAAKPVMGQGASAAEIIAPAVEDCERELARIADLGGDDEGPVRVQRRAMALLKECDGACVSQGVTGGDAAFALMSTVFSQRTAAFEAAVAAYRQKIEHAFAYIDAAFGNATEMVLFTTEMTAHKDTARFIGRYGCEAFTRFSKALQTTDNRRELLARIDAVL